jgi:hypothetical protein
MGHAVLRRVVSSRLQAALVTWMARSGEGTDASLRWGSLPLPVHFYSPVPDLEDLTRRDVWARRSPLAGIDFREQGQLDYLLELGRQYGAECFWPANANGDAAGFYTENDAFSFGCAAATHCIIRARKPRNVFEIGSGMSSIIISSALQMNAGEGAPSARYTVIDPYPSPRLETLRGTKPVVLPERVEVVDMTTFDNLGRGDILFVDSGHVARIGGDVNFLILDVLPRLAAGVVVHFHDIGLPFEYPELYAKNPAFRMFWTEAYLLQAFLACNHDYEVLLAIRYLMTDHLEVFQRAFPFYDRSKHLSGSGSFWIARK